ncbi:hypothetical protein RND81_01G175300 [Saponaria officinalis]|uniref:Cytochrome c oxidase subunit 6b-1 n=1 Tax=Saponaria officinalis TaxID=3572 RepID=A0AAW1NGT9_SAPOF
MAEVAPQSPPSLSEDYLLPSGEKPVESKPVDVAKEEAPVSATSEETAPEKTEEAPAVSEESTEAPAGDTETSTEEPVQAPEAEDSSEAPEPEESASEEVDEETPEVKLETAPADFRFPTTNQTRHCFTRYIEYHRCVAAKGDDAPECDKFAKYYRSLCPGEWVDRWNEQRENGTFPGPL